MRLLARAIPHETSLRSVLEGVEGGVAVRRAVLTALLPFLIFEPSPRFLLRELEGSTPRTFMLKLWWRTTWRKVVVWWRIQRAKSGWWW